MTPSSLPPDPDQLRDHLHALEERITRIEAHLGLESLTPQESSGAPGTTAPATEEEALEFRIGQTWFAKVGIVVLAIGVAFLLTFPYQNLPPILPSLFGYLLVGAVVLLSRSWRYSYELLSRYLLGGAMLLLYFTTLRLHFFSPQAVVTQKPLLLVLLLLVVGINLAVAVRRRSIYLTGLSLTLGYTTAIAGGDTPFVFVLISVMAALIAYFTLHYRWHALIMLGIVLSYLTHGIWAINNPFLGNPLQLVTAPAANLLFLLLYAVILAAGDLLRSRELLEEGGVLVRSGLNGLGAYSLYLLLTLASFTQGFGFSHVMASAVFLLLSIAFWLRDKSRYATFVYAMLGYVALSVAIIHRFNVPDNLFWLSWQTVLVVSTAVWFRSRFIVVANFIIYLVVFVAYLFLGGPVGITSLSFGVIALLSARILNWKKDRLELKTEMMRNAYLASAFFVIPYALYHTVPSGYVSLSWVGVALFYYVASLYLKSHKYRWMALLTLVITIAHVFIADITRLEPAFRIASFLVLGVVLVAISIVYSRMRGKPRSDDAQKEEKV